MKTLVYIGNKVSKHGFNVSTVDTLGALLHGEGYEVVSASSVKNSFFRLLDMLWTVFKCRKKADFVLIDTYSTLAFWYAFLICKLCKFLSLPYVPILHGGNLPNRFKKSKKATQSIVKNAYKTVIPSQYLNEHLKEFEIPRVVIIPNAIELKNYTFKTRTSFEPKLLWVRSLAKIYNPEMAVQTLSLLRKDYQNAQLTMIGPFKDISRTEMQDLIDSYNVKIDLTGKLEKEEWISKASEYDIFLNTTTIDNMPVSVIEAMALGLPVVSTNVGGLPFLIEHEKTGQLVESNNPQMMSNAIKYYLENPDFTTQTVIQAHAEVQKYDWNVIKYQWVDLFESR